MAYLNKRQQARREAKLVEFREYAKSGDRCLGFPMYRPANDQMYESTRHGFVNSCRAGSPEQQRWQSGSVFEGEVAMRGDFAQLQRGTYPGKINVKTSAANVIRNWKRYTVEWILKVSGILVQPAYNSLGFTLHKSMKQHSLNSRSVWQWLIIDPLVFGIDGLGQITDDIVEMCLEDLAKFEKAAKIKESLSWHVHANFADSSDERVDEDVPTMIAELIKASRELVHEFATFINSGFVTDDLELPATLKLFAESDRKRNVHDFKRHGWANEFTQEALDKVPDRVKKLGNRDIPMSVFDRPKTFKFHQEDLYDRFFSWLPRVERELFTLSIARAVLGKRTDLYNTDADLSAWRYAPLLHSEPGVGKSISLECIREGALALGLSCGNLPQRLEAGFGMGVFTGNFVISDDMSKKDFAGMSAKGVLKSALSGGIIQSERKGKDAVDVEATAVLFVSINEMDSKDVADMDDGIKDRLLHMVSKVRVNPEDEVIPPEDANRTNGIGKLLEDELIPTVKAAYGENWKAALGQYLISCALERSGDVINTGIADYVRVVRRQMRTTMGKTGSVKKLGQAMVTLAAAAAHYLTATDAISSEQVKTLLERFSTGKVAIGLPQLAAPLYLAGSVEARLIAKKDIPHELQSILDGTFQGRSSMHSELTNGGAIKALTGQVTQASASKGVSYLMDSVQTQDYLPTSLGKLLPVLNQESRTMPALFQKLPQTPNLWRWVCYQLTRQNSNWVSPSADEHNKCKQIASTLLGCLA